MGSLPKNVIVADFETTNNNKHTEVYLWCVYTWDDRVFWGSTLVEFYDCIESFGSPLEIFFHNGSKFDFHFLKYLFTVKKNGKNVFKQRFLNPETIDGKYQASDYVKNNSEEWGYEIKYREFMMLVDSKKIINIKLGLSSKKLYRKNKSRKKDEWVTAIANFRDSNLLFRASLSSIGKMLGVPKMDDFKGYLEIKEGFMSKDDFKKKVKEWEKHVEYVVRDCEILLKFLREASKIIPFRHWKNTIASTSYNDFLRKSTPNLVDLLWRKKNIRIKKFTRGGLIMHFFQGKIYKSTALSKIIMDILFPVKWMDFAVGGGRFIRDEVARFYRGGMTNVNSLYKGVPFSKKDGFKFNHYDINSSYPSTMLNCDLPWGEPVKDGAYKMKVALAIGNMENKLGMPFLGQLHEAPHTISKSAQENVYLKKIGVSERFFLDSSEIKNLKYYGKKWHLTQKYSFNTFKGSELFGSYIHFWSGLKIKYKKEKNKVLTFIAKIFLNSLYGKFGERTRRDSNIINTEGEFPEYERVKYVGKCSKYLPLAVAITSHSRMALVNSVKKNFKYVAYYDTDSLVIEKRGIKKIGLEEGTALGLWSLEMENIHTAIFRTGKQYYEENEEEKKVVFAGINTTNVNINFENMIKGVKVDGQLSVCDISGGIFLNPEIKKINHTASWEYCYNPALWFYENTEAKIREKWENNVKNQLLLIDKML